MSHQTQNTTVKKDHIIDHPEDAPLESYTSEADFCLLFSQLIIIPLEKNHIHTLKKTITLVHLDQMQLLCSQLCQLLNVNFTKLRLLDTTQTDNIQLELTTKGTSSVSDQVIYSLIDVLSQYLLALVQQESENTSEKKDTTESKYESEYTTTESEYESEYTTTESEDESDLMYCKDSELYVITVDKIPRYYVKGYKESISKMWSLARQFQTNYDNYSKYIYKVHDTNEIHVIGYDKFFIVSYDQILYRLQVYEINELISVK